MSKSTPGPWEVTGHDGFHVYVVGSRGETIAKVAATINGPLIAAAPDLLEACKLGLSTFDVPHDVQPSHARTAINALIDAIAKAEGTDAD